MNRSCGGHSYWALVFWVRPLVVAVEVILNLSNILQWLSQIKA